MTDAPSERPDEAVTPATPRELPDVAMYLFFAIMVVLGVDLALDTAHGPDAKNMLTDGAATILAAGGSILGWRVWRNEKRARAERAAQEEAKGSSWPSVVAQWRGAHHHATGNFRTAVEEQLRDWDLGPDETRIARLLIAGHTNRDVARVLGVSLGTVERLVAEICRKSGAPDTAAVRRLFVGPALGLDDHLLG